MIIGSFLSVCIFRIPYGRYPEDWDPESDEVEFEQTETFTITVPPRSMCPKCKQQLKCWHNIPLVSWFILRGKCAFCSTPISFRYPLVELLSALCAYLAYSNFGLTPTALVAYLFSAALIVISFIDYDYYIIPNVISLPGTVIGLLLVLINQFTSVFTRPIVSGIVPGLIGILSGAGFLLLISRLYYVARKKDGLGLGDVKLLAMTGALFGMKGAFYTIFIGSLMGSVGGVILALSMGRRMSKPLPFGPYLALANVHFIFFGFRYPFFELPGGLFM